MAGHDHDHDHHHDHDHGHGSELSETQLRVRALETVLTLQCGQRFDATRSVGNAFQVRIDHHADETGEVDGRCPPQLRPRLRAVADEVFDFGRSSREL